MEPVDTPATYHQPQRPPGARTLERLLAAAEDQLREEEVDVFTIQKVLDRTSLSVGAFYSRFPDKTALLHAVQERVYARLEPKIIAALETEADGRPVPGGRGRSFPGYLTSTTCSTERKLLRAFWILSTFDPVMRRRAEQVNHLRRSAFIDAVLRGHRNEIAHPDPEEAMAMVYAMCTSVMQTRVLSSGPDSTRDLRCHR